MRLDSRCTYHRGSRSPMPSRSVPVRLQDRKSTRLNSSHMSISYAVFCLKKKKITNQNDGFTEELRVERLEVITLPHDDRAVLLTDANLDGSHISRHINGPLASCGCDIHR